MKNYLTSLTGAKPISFLLISKTNFILFKPRQKRQTLDINVEISQCAIGRVKETAFLGVILDENLTWKPYIGNVSGKISKSIGIIYNASFCLPTTYLCTMYFCLVYPYLVYCISVWGSTYPSNLSRIFLLQKKVIRIISKSAFDAHTEPIFKQLKILKLSDIYRSQIGKLCFLLRKAFFLMHSVRCFCWLIKFIIIIFETPTLFTCFHVEQISNSLQCASKDPNCFSTEIQNFSI